jgi:CXXX repeat radical SAM target protein
MSNKNEENFSRRGFFKQAVKKALPILGAVVLMNLPAISQTPNGKVSMDCSSNCEGKCQGCGGCSGCVGCSGTAKNTCIVEC